MWLAEEGVTNDHSSSWIGGRGHYMFSAKSGLRLRNVFLGVSFFKILPILICALIFLGK